MRLKLGDVRDSSSVSTARSGALLQDCHELSTLIVELSEGWENLEVTWIPNSGVAYLSSYIHVTICTVVCFLPVNPDNPVAQIYHPSNTVKSVQSYSFMLTLEARLKCVPSWSERVRARKVNAYLIPLRTNSSRLLETRLLKESIGFYLKDCMAYLWAWKYLGWGQHISRINRNGSSPDPYRTFPRKYVLFKDNYCQSDPQDRKFCQGPKIASRDIRRMQGVRLCNWPSSDDQESSGRLKWHTKSILKNT